MVTAFKPTSARDFSFICEGLFLYLPDTELVNIQPVIIQPCMQVSDTARPQIGQLRQFEA